MDGVSVNGVVKIRQHGSMMAKLIYVDNSNLFIEGMRNSAISKGRSGKHKDYGFRIDYGKLYSYLKGTSDVKKAYLFGSKPPPNDSLWKCVENQGYQVVTFERDRSGREK